MNVIIGFIDAAIAIIKYKYQFKLNIGFHSFAIMSPTAKPANALSLKSMKENLNFHIRIKRFFFLLSIRNILKSVTKKYSV